MANYVGNISTVIKVFGLMFAGWIMSISVAHGLDLGVSTTDLAEAIGVLIGLGLSYVDAKYPNSLIANDVVGDEDDC